MPSIFTCKMPTALAAVLYKSPPPIRSPPASPAAVSPAAAVAAAAAAVAVAPVAVERCTAAMGKFENWGQDKATTTRYQTDPNGQTVVTTKTSGSMFTLSASLMKEEDGSVRILPQCSSKKGTGNVYSNTGWLHFCKSFSSVGQLRSLLRQLATYQLTLVCEVVVGRVNGKNILGEHGNEPADAEGYVIVNVIMDNRVSFLYVYSMCLYFYILTNNSMCRTGEPCIPALSSLSFLLG